MQQVKIIMEKHSDGYIAYPLGLKGVVVGQGDTFEDAMADVKISYSLSHRVVRAGTCAMRLDAGQIEVMDQAMADVLRKKTPAERLAIAFGMWESARVMLLTQLAERHPEWNTEQVEREVVKRMSHGAV